MYEDKLKLIDELYKLCLISPIPLYIETDTMTPVHPPSVF